MPGPFTETETVVTHVCNDATSFWGEVELDKIPEGSNAETIVQIVNELMQKIEDRFNLLKESQPNTECVINGAIVIDCTDGTSFEVSVVEDINSISFKNCGPGATTNIKFACAGDDCCISGWPLEMTCDICGTIFDLICLDPGNVSPIGVNFDSGGNPFKATAGGGGTPGGAEPLSIKCEETASPGTENEKCLFDCEGVAEIDVVVEGGLVPISWSVTRGSELQSSEPSPVITTGVGEDSRRATITPPVIGSPDPATGTVVQVSTCLCTPCVSPPPPCNCRQISANYRCDGTRNTDTFCQTNNCVTSCPDCNSDPPFPTPTHPVACGDVIDRRTQMQIDAGNCVPCAIGVDGAVVTATDALGNSVSITLVTDSGGTFPV